MHRMKSSSMEEVLLYTENVDKSTAEIESVGGRVTIQMGNKLLLAELPSDFDINQSPFRHSSTQVPSTATRNVLNKVEAYKMYRENKISPGPHWTEETAPRVIPRIEPIDKSLFSLTMTGKIAICMVFPSGPGSLAMSDPEVARAYSEVIAGLKVWTDNAPASARLSFVVPSMVVRINVDQAASCPTFESCHNVYVNAIINAFSNVNNLDDLTRLFTPVAEGSTSMFLAFISKYRQGHFAYASSPGGPIYMQYQNGYMGTDKIDVVFGHEVGHIFDAPDEYGGCNCFRQYGQGTCTAKNSNCITCTRSQQECVMDKGQQKVCPYTRKQIGWC